ncbi:hypothetical protein KC921_02600, partial [Candidatus Woesebacteria bacterium]|nr:hypothetical protein [Candidatus Woesebacteria bacterium]
VKIHNGRVVARGFTSSWYELRESVSVGKIDKGNAAPKTVDEVMAIYAALAASKRTHSGVECFVLRAQTSDEEWELIALAYASEEIPRTVLDNRIHAGRKRQLYEAAAKSTFLPNYLGKEGLTSKEKVIVRDAIEKARSISNFSDVEQLAGFLEVLMRIDRFRALNPGAIAFLVSKLFNDVWSGMGDEGVPNKSVGLGLNGRPI